MGHRQEEGIENVQHKGTHETTTCYKVSSTNFAWDELRDDKLFEFTIQIAKHVNIKIN